MVIYVKISDWIQVIAICISLFVSVISILQTRKSIKMTEKSVYDANRPYVSVFVETFDTVYFEKYLVIKNFGQTAAKILELEFQTKLDSSNEQFKLQSLVGGTIAPGQKFTSSLDSDFNDLVVVSFSYQDMDGNIYHEQVDVKTDMSKQLLWHSQTKSSDSNEATAIKLSAQAIVKNLK